MPVGQLHEVPAAFGTSGERQVSGRTQVLPFGCKPDGHVQPVCEEFSTIGLRQTTSGTQPLPATRCVLFWHMHEVGEERVILLKRQRHVSPLSFVVRGSHEGSGGTMMADFTQSSTFNTLTMCPACVGPDGEMLTDHCGTMPRGQPFVGTATCVKSLRSAI